MKKAIIGIIVATVVVYIWGFLYWGVSTLPYSAWHKTTDDEQAQQMLREYFPESGTYFIPHLDHDPDRRRELALEGPVGLIHLDNEGADPNDPTGLIGGFVLDLIVVALMAGLFHVAGAKEFRDFARISVVGGIVAVVLIDGGDIIWWRVPVDWKIWQAVYDFSFWLIAGHMLGIFMKEEQPND